MKKILITGKNSYVGNSYEQWVEQYTGKYQVQKISVRDDSWRGMSFNKFDTILHVAGIAHVSTDPKMEEKYYKVNRDLTIDLARKAKNDGVKQFVFLSSIIVYGELSNGRRFIDEDTVPRPSNFYGESKLQAEKGILSLSDDTFKVVILRPPMIYGKGSKGNYPKLSKIARSSPLFPNIENRRSMLHIDNLSEFIRLIVDNEDNGIYFPQNEEYVQTSEMVRLIAEVHGKKIKLIQFFNPLIGFLSNKVGIINKVFGDLAYEQGMSKYKQNYRVRNMSESIYDTEINDIVHDKDDILVMADNSLETVGGEQESTKIILQGINKKYRTGVIQPGDISKPIENVNYYRITKKTRIKHIIKNPLLFLNYIFKVRKIIKKKAPSVIHTQAQVSFFIVSLLRKLRLIPKTIKLIHTERGLYTKYNNFFKRIFLFFMKELDVLVTTTEFNLKYWKEAILNKGLSMEFKVIENTAGKLFESYNPDLANEKSDELVIGFAGRYTGWKNWPLAVEICKKLEKELNSNLHVKMAIGCLDEDAERQTLKMFEEMRAILGERFEGMINIDLEVMDKFYYDIDLFVLTSNYNTESFGRTLVEAMSRNTAVLTTNSGGSVEVVGNLINVCNSAEDFITRILQLHSDKTLMDDEKIQNLKRVRNKYSLDNNLEKHLKLYNSL